MAGKSKNIAASVHQRLLNKARESSRPFNEILQYFAIERFIYRLCKSPYADRFVLKGALMFKKTFEKRKTPLTSEPTIFNSTFMKDHTKQAQWLGFKKKTKLTDAPTSFEDVAGCIKMFLQPIVVSMINKQTFRFFWAAPGPWHI
jgi:hypothetical protein